MEKHSFEFSGEVLDQRNDLTGPRPEDKAAYPERPKNVPIQESKGTHKK
ncbi:hypothetical protein [Bacillus sp. FJAT-49736]|nr:hypothetical protein [Bacillus sp. FJAT-49736]MBS4172888.1 hypothetical protein [Bacillus sp. FJAT-49736]